MDPEGYSKIHMDYNKEKCTANMLDTFSFTVILSVFTL